MARWGWAVVAVALLVGCVEGGGVAEEPGGVAGEPADSPVSASPAGTYPEESVSGFLTADGRFGELVDLLERREPGRFMSELARASWPHTFLGPTDAAFERLPPALAAALSEDGELLRRLLSYHVLPGDPRPLAELSPGSLRTLSGEVQLVDGPEPHTVRGVAVIDADIAVAGEGPCRTPTPTTRCATASSGTTTCTGRIPARTSRRGPRSRQSAAPAARSSSPSIS